MRGVGLWVLLPMGLLEAPLPWPADKTTPALSSPPAAEKLIHTQTEKPNLLRLRGGQDTPQPGFFSKFFRSLLAKLGIFTKKGQLLVIGLDNAGKSSLLTMLVQGKVVQHEPTHQPVSDEFKVGSLKLRAVDMGGHAIARRMWREYSKDADAVVFIVDAADRERFEEAALELHKLLAGQSLPPQAPVLVLGNKVDLPHAAREEELYYCLGIDQMGQFPVRLFPLARLSHKIYRLTDPLGLHFVLDYRTRRLANLHAPSNFSCVVYSEALATCKVWSGSRVMCENIGKTKLVLRDSRSSLRDSPLGAAPKALCVGSEVP